MTEQKNVATMEKNITDVVTNRINDLQAIGAINLPKSYAVGNEMKMAWFVLQDVKDRSGKLALEVCTKESIANALLYMAVQGLSVWKKQCDFIVYGNKLKCEKEYHGVIALALRTGEVTAIPSAEVIYEGDKFQYRIVNGKKEVISHEQDFENINIEKIKGAYAIVPLRDGGFHTEIMTIQQIKQSWMQGAMKGQSPAHKNFTDQMAKKTVISRALKLYISSSDDDYLLNGEEGEGVEPQTEEKPLEAVTFDDVEIIDESTGEVTTEPQTVDAVEDEPVQEKPKAQAKQQEVPF